MGIFGGKKYIKCNDNGDGSKSCIMYRPTNDGKKIVTASIKVNLSPDGFVAIDDVDGDQTDIAQLEEYFRKRAKVNSNSPGTA